MEMSKPYGLKQGTKAEEYLVVVERNGQKVAVAKDLPGILDEVQRRINYEETITTIKETFPVFPWDGAHALAAVLTRRYGWVNGVPTPGFFGSNPPEMISVEVAPGVHQQVPWGRMQLPGISGYLETHTFKGSKGRLEFGLTAQVKRKNEAEVAAIFAELRMELKERSIYRGQALRIQFQDEDGDLLSIPEVSLLDTSSIRKDELVFPRMVEAAIETSIFTPLRRRQELAQHGIPFKRGVLLVGTYGVGKTLAARVASKIAVEEGITYIYSKKAAELAETVEFARQYEPAVVFCEDIDREAAGERDEGLDELLNVLDGIDSKSSQIMVVLTTNAVERINPAMLRPGRLDAVIDVERPDAETVGRLLRKYGAASIPPETDVEEAASTLAGAIPAVVAEVVQRAKLSALKRSAKGQVNGSLKLDSQALLEAAETMHMQLRLLEGPGQQPNGHTLDAVLTSHLNTAVEKMHQNLKGELSDRL